MEDQTATEADLGSTTDLLALVQGKPWERETQGRNKCRHHSGYSGTRGCDKDIAGERECNRDLITKRIVLLREQGQRGPSGKLCTEVREL